MKKYLLAALFCLGLTAATAQSVWCPPGAQWHYHYGAWNYWGYIELNYIGDTVYNGIPCHRLDQHIEYIIYPDNDTSGSHQTCFTYESGGIVFAAVPGLSDWDTLINYNAVPGETWGSFPESGTNVLVEDTGQKVIQGYNLRYLAVTYTGDLGSFYHDTIYERIGYTGGIYPFFMQFTTDNDHGGFCNYSDSSFADWNHSDSICTLLPAVGIFDLPDIKPLTFSPNPAAGIVKIDGLHDLTSYSITVTMLSGRTVRQFRDPQMTFDLSDLSGGIYFVTVLSRHGIYRGRLMLSK